VWGERLPTARKAREGIAPRAVADAVATRAMQGFSKLFIRVSNTGGGRSEKLYVCSLGETL